MRDRLRRSIEPFTDLVFPPVCACCGDLLIQRTDMICDFCLHTRFERDRSINEDILPESTLFRFSMWQFDKMGFLQNLLHKLKYDHCIGIGVQLGREAGRLLKEQTSIHEKDSWVIIPVPLHKKRFRKRGYNQAREIARGLGESINLKLVDENKVLRVKNTQTQTGLNSDERVANLAGAFRIKDQLAFKGVHALLVDDVYTTGATTFELAQSLHTISGKPCGIVTLARA